MGRHGRQSRPGLPVRRSLVRDAVNQVADLDCQPEASAHAEPAVDGGLRSGRLRRGIEQPHRGAYHAGPPDRHVRRPNGNPPGSDRSEQERRT